MSSNSTRGVAGGAIGVDPLLWRGLSLDSRILRAIRRIMRSVDLYSFKLATQFGVTVPQLTCLKRVVDSGPMSQKALAQDVDLSASTMVGIVDRLEKKGLVVRERSRTDRRQVLISATEAGAALAAGSPTPLQDRLATALHSLPESEQAAIAGSLERIVELMEIRQVQASPILDTGVSLGAPTDSLEEKRTEIPS